MTFTQERAERIRKAWKQAILAGDIDALMALYAPQAILKPTFSPIIRNTPSTIRAYFIGGGQFHDPGLFHQGFRRIDFHENVSVLTNDGAIDSGRYEFIKDSEHKIAAFYTFCYQKTSRHDGIILAHHSSLAG